MASIKNMIQRVLTGIAAGPNPADRAEARELLAKLKEPETEYAAPKRAASRKRRGGTR